MHTGRGCPADPLFPRLPWVPRARLLPLASFACFAVSLPLGLRGENRAEPPHVTHDAPQIG